MADTNDLVTAVIKTLNDGAEGFKHIGEEIKDPTVKSFFLSEAGTRASFAQELKSASGMTDVGGSAVASVHRTWADLKAKLGGGDHAQLETAEQGEDSAKKAYKEALEDANLPAPVRSLLLTQQTHIMASHDKVKAFRDATA